MIIHEKIQLKIDNEIIKLTDDYKQELLDLVNLVQPGILNQKQLHWEIITESLLIKN